MNAFIRRITAAARVIAAIPAWLKTVGPFPDTVPGLDKPRAGERPWMPADPMEIRYDEEQGVYW